MNNFEKLCRVCMRVSDNLISLFTVDEDFIEFNVKLYSCVPSIQIDQFSFPTFICDNCVECLRQAYSFRQLCIKSTLRYCRFVNNNTDEFEHRDLNLKIVECTGAKETETGRKDTDKVERIINDAFAKINGDITNTKEKPMDCESNGHNSTSGNDFDDLNKDVKDTIESANDQASGSISDCSAIYCISDDSDLELPYVCTKCNQGFMSTSDLSEHLQSHVMSKLSLKCEICSSHFATMDELNNHDCRESLECSFCFKTFKSSAALFSHKYHKHMKPYECSKCNKRFPNSKCFKQHRVQSSKNTYCCLPK